MTFPVSLSWYLYNLVLKHPVPTICHFHSLWGSSTQSIPYTCLLFLPAYSMHQKDWTHKKKIARPFPKEHSKTWSKQPLEKSGLWFWKHHPTKITLVTLVFQWFSPANGRSPDALARLRTICNGEIDPYCTWSMPSLVSGPAELSCRGSVPVWKHWKARVGQLLYLVSFWRRGRWWKMKKTFMKIRWFFAYQQHGCWTWWFRYLLSNSTSPGMWSCKLVRQTSGWPTWLGWHDDMEPVEETHRGWCGPSYRDQDWRTDVSLCGRCVFEKNAPVRSDVHL